MKDKLKHYIMVHRNELDAFAPAPSVWEKINDGLAHIAPTPSPTGAAGSWLKYLLLSVSIVAVVSIAVLRKNKPSAKNEQPFISIDTAITKDTIAAETIHAQVEELILAPQKINESPALDSLQRLSPIPILLGKTSIGKGVSFFDYPEPVFSPFTNPLNTSAPKNIGRATETKELGKNSYQETIDTSFSGITKIEVQVSFCNVKLVQSKREQLTVKGDIKIDKKGLFSDNISKYHITCTKTGNTLVVKVTDDKDGSWRDNIVIGSYDMEGHLDIELPMETDDVAVETYSGNVEVSTFTGRIIKLSASSGNVAATSINSPIAAKTYSGNITLATVNGDVVSESSSGNQKHSSIKGTIIANAYSGNFVIANHTGDGIIKTSSGNQTYTNVTGDLNAESYSGSIIFTELKGMVSVSTSSGNITGNKVRLTANSEFKSYSGDISMDLENAASDLSFELKSFSGSLLVNNGSQSYTGERQLKVKQGSLLVKGSTSSGSQSFR